MFGRRGRGRWPSRIVAVLPAANWVPGGTCSSALRTGTRCASRTQLNVGFTLGSRLGPDARPILDTRGDIRILGMETRAVGAEEPRHSEPCLVDQGGG